MMRQLGRETVHNELWYGVCVPEDFLPTVTKIARAERCSVHDAIVKLAIEGAECRRTHGRDNASGRR